MYNRDVVKQLSEFISDRDGIRDKSSLAYQVQNAFQLVKDRSKYKWIRLFLAMVLRPSSTDAYIPHIHPPFFY